jgi:hypothetical protein
MIRFVRLARLAKGLKKMDSINNKSNLKINAGIQRLGMFAGGLILGAHVCACFWIMMSQFNDYNWLTNKITSLAGGGEEISL